MERPAKPSRGRDSIDATPGLCGSRYHRHSRTQLSRSSRGVLGVKFNGLIRAVTRARATTSGPALVVSSCRRGSFDGVTRHATHMTDINGGPSPASRREHEAGRARGACNDTPFDYEQMLTIPKPGRFVAEAKRGFQPERKKETKKIQRGLCRRPYEKRGRTPGRAP